MKQKYKELSNFEFIMKFIGIIIGIVYISMAPISTFWTIPSKMIISLIVIGFSLSLEKNAMILKGELFN